jgi:hypothetical protein
MLFTFIACQESEPEPGKNSLIKTTVVNPGAECETGGVLIESGLDEDANGTLDPSEVTSSNYVCNGVNGLNALVSVENISSNESCPNGGVVLRSGQDTNVNGILDESEVISTVFICDGVESLIRVEQEAAGANCATGGLMVLTGMDQNGNDILDDNEVSNTLYVCNGINGIASLITVTAEPAGSNCASGGLKFDSGQDDNGNGTLETAEIDATSYICDGNNNQQNQTGTAEIKGVVRDAFTRNGLAGVTVTLTLNSATVGQATTDSGGNYTISNIAAGSNYNLTYEINGYISASRFTIEVTEGAANFIETTLQVDNQYSGTGTVTGRVTNAFTGQGESDVTLSVRQGLGQTTGNILAAVTTDSNGDYSLNSLTAGNYTVQMQKTDFITSFFSLVVLGGQTVADQNGTISPSIATGEIRIVLEWGDAPSDLDSHLTGPLNGGGRFHCYFSNKTPQGSSTNLDVDDTSRFGPETITVTQTIGGTYRYSVHDYSNKSSNSSTALGASNATVRVFIGNAAPRIFSVPNQSGTLWTVFEIDGTSLNLTPVNRMTYESSSSSVTRPENASDVDLIRALPSK